MGDDAARLLLERDLYAGLLSLGDAADLPPLLERSLQLVMRLAGAERGLVEVRVDDGAPLRITAGIPPGEVGEADRAFSTTVVREALASGRTVSTACAVEDPRYADARSVQAAGLRAVVCAPLVSRDASGVLYLAERAAPGPFDEAARTTVELFAKHVAPLLSRVVRSAEQVVDATLELRAEVPAQRLAGKSRALASLLRQIKTAAAVPITVLVTGETGTGKSALARSLHEASPRAAAPFVELNCAAIPEALFESELFGAEKGAHSTATRRIEGKIEAAQGGTLFLDEIGELPLPLQAKLLGFLQSKTFLRLGGTKATPADVRIIAATNRSLEEQVAARTFREDLFYRLDVLRIHVPPLRERTEDIPAIAAQILARLAEEHGRSVPLSPGAEAALVESSWPGNVRQLENVVARGWAAALGEGARCIDVVHLFPGRAPSPEETPGEKPRALDWREATLQFQKHLLEETLAATTWNVAETARRLGLARSHLNDLIKAHGLARPG